jgi:hypothetical protein
MTIASIEPQRPRRRWIIPGLVLVAVGVTAYVVVDGLKNCRWLDRLLDVSGCVTTYRVTGLTPLYLWRALAVPADGKTIAYFGEERGDSARRTTLVVLDAETGQEKARTAIVQSRDALMAVASPDGQRTALLCETRQPCIDGQHSGIIVSSLDGRRLATLAKTDLGTLRDTQFPGEPELPAWAGYNAIGLPGDRVASRETGTRQVVVRRVSDRSELVRLRGRDGPYLTTALNTMAASPSGHRLAILAESLTVDSKRTVDVFDLRTGVQVASIALEGGRLTLAWVGEDRLVVPRTAYSPTGYAVDATDMNLEIYAMPKVP